MKKKIVLVLIAFLASIFVSCASTQFHIENNSKFLSSTSKIKEDDFIGQAGDNFFMEDINYNCSSLAVFKMMKTVIEQGDAKEELLDNEFQREASQELKKGQLICCTPNEDAPNEKSIAYWAYNKKKKAFVGYFFTLVIDDTAYNRYKENNSYKVTCDSNIKECNAIIQKCSNPTIQKSRTVKVPYTVTERILVPGNIGSRTSHYGSSETTYDHYETRTYTEYRDEIQYYTVPDPNYNPKAVAKAKNDLKYWEAEKNDVSKKLEKLPFNLFYY